jgi:hypothetical protein
VRPYRMAKPLRVVGWQFQLDGIVEDPLGVHGCSVMEDYYSWSLGVFGG